jgi:uncharacterized membrane protein YkvA (DUF1232 family)
MLRQGLIARARRLKVETLALYSATRHPETPWYAKLFAAGVVAYALGPIDLIPDFIPIPGYLDDLVLVPLGIALVIKMIPDEIMGECRKRAQTAVAVERSEGRIAGGIIILIWIVLAALGVAWAYRTVTHAS